MGINELKSKITDKTKLVFGAVVLILGFLIMAILGGKFFLTIVLTALPAILLVVPNDTIKNSRIIGIILIIWLIINLLGYIIGIINPHSYFESNYNFISAGYQFSGNDMYYWHEIEMLENYAFFSCILMSIYTIINIIGALLFFVPTAKENNNGNVKTTSKNERNYDKYCSECGHGIYNDSKFCPGCGTKLAVPILQKPEETSAEEEEIKDRYCSECGFELYEDSEFCPECGSKLKY